MVGYRKLTFVLIEVTTMYPTWEEFDTDLRLECVNTSLTQTQNYPGSHSILSLMLQLNEYQVCVTLHHVA